MAIGVMFGLLLTVEMQLSVKALRTTRPNRADHRRRRVRAANNGPGPNSAIPAIGRATATMRPGIR